MNINNPGKRKSPYIYQGMPIFRSNLERDKWWAEELRRWVEGYNGLTGHHYFYLSQCKIKDAQGPMIRPRFRDVDQWIFEHFAQCIKEQKITGYFKARGVGLSSIFAAAMPNYYARVFPGSTSLLTSCDFGRVASMFMDKLEPTHKSMHEFVRHHISNLNKSKHSVYLRLKMPIRNEWGEREYAESEIYCQETTTDPKKFSGKRAKYGFYDEFPLHPKRQALLGSSDPCFLNQADLSRIGYLVTGGTVEDGIPADSLDELVSIYKGEQDSDMKIMFIEAWMGMYMDDAGYSNKQKAVEEIMRKRDRLSKLEDKTALNTYIKNYPLSIEDVFYLKSKSIITPDVMDKIHAQKIYLLQNPPPIYTYSLIESNRGLEPRLDPKGDFNILKHPIDGHVYRAGNDPIPFDAENPGEEESKRSKNSIWIKDDTTQEYVAFMTKRSHDSYEIAGKMVTLQRYYGCKLMPERNRFAVLRDRYKEMGAYSLLADEPLMFRGGMKKPPFEKGWSKNSYTKERAYQFFVDYLRDHHDKIYFPQIIRAAETFLEGNDDDFDAIVSCEVFSRDELQKSEAKTRRKVFKQISVVRVRPDGSKYVDFVTLEQEVDGNGQPTRGEHTGFGNNSIFTNLC